MSVALLESLSFEGRASADDRGLDVGLLDAGSESAPELAANVSQYRVVGWPAAVV